MAEDKKPGGPRKLLVADDNEAIQALVKRTAEKRGHQVIQATTGKAAIELALQTQPDLIVLDLDFPDADGRDVLGKLKADPRTANIPVVVWSGRQGHGSDSRISLDLGADDYVEKADAQLLITKLERVLLRIEGGKG
ncbi:MAG: response regulator [Myxococcales bacterium]